MQGNLSSFTPEVEISHYIAFICNSCIKVLSEKKIVLHIEVVI